MRLLPPRRPRRKIRPTASDGEVGTELWSIPASEPQASPRPTIDLNGDGLLDGLWRDAVSGVVVGSLYDGFGDSTVLGGSLDWSVVGSEDADGDGRSDILWRQNSNGVTVVSLMNGSVQAGSTVLGGDLNWSILRRPGWQVG